MKHVIGTLKVMAPLLLVLGIFGSPLGYAGNRCQQGALPNLSKGINSQSTTSFVAYYMPLATLTGAPETEKRILNHEGIRYTERELNRLRTSLLRAAKGSRVVKEARYPVDVRFGLRGIDAKGKETFAVYFGRNLRRAYVNGCWIEMKGTLARTVLAIAIPGRKEIRRRFGDVALTPDEERALRERRKLTGEASHIEPSGKR